MTKFTILLIALLFVAHTCCALKWQEHESCSDQLQGINLKKCAKHIMERIQSDDEEHDDADVLTTVRGRIKYIRREKGKQDEEEELQKFCCNEITELNTPSCQCRALQKIMEKQSDKLKEKEKREMEMELMDMAMTCGLGPMSWCDLSSQD